MQEDQTVADMAIDVLARQNLPRERARERKRERAEEKRRAKRAAESERFVQAQSRKLQLRKGGQLAGLLGEPLPGETLAALERLTAEDQRQAEEGLVALMRGGKVFYKHVDKLCPEDMPTRMAVERM